MKRFLKFISSASFITLFLFSASAFLKADSSEPKPFISEPVKKLIVGEKVIYSLKWWAFEVGKSEALVEDIVTINGREAYHIRIFNRSNAFLDLIFKVRDVYHSYLDVKDLKTLRFEKNVVEGRYRAHEEIDFDHETGTAHYHSFLNGSRKAFKFTPGSVDAISAVYKYRFENLDPDKEVRIPVTWDEKQYDVRIPILEEKVLKKSFFGSLDAFKVKPYVYKPTDPNVKSSRVEIWVSNGRGRIPMEMRAKVPIAGSVKAILTDYSVISRELRE